ncbi:cbb3-type cytochrome c oxidase subunit I, partial [Paraburkholderia dilworthii]|uniref:cbb3-type cytochrome c oxidase subunit I n=1 Tax=Paraburkholderia dilworthii TaxID=948106 RepID=UPI001FCA711C
MFHAKRLVLAHFWLAFIAFIVALFLGAWQMLVRSPLAPWIGDPELYYRSVTAHGSVMAYVLPTLVSMGFGYAIVELALAQRLAGLKWAWAAFIMLAVGAVMAMVPVALGKASVLYTFYPPMIGSPFYYLGVVLVVVGSWIWVALMHVNLAIWRRANPGKPVPLAMFANVAGAYLWAWTAVGAALEILLQILPVAFGLTNTIDAGLSRVLFSWTLHAIVYFFNWAVMSRADLRWFGFGNVVCAGHASFRSRLINHGTLHALVGQAWRASLLGALGAQQSVAASSRPSSTLRTLPVGSMLVSGLHHAVASIEPQRKSD